MAKILFLYLQRKKKKTHSTYALSGEVGPAFFNPFQSR